MTGTRIPTSFTPSLHDLTTVYSISPKRTSKEDSHGRLLPSISTFMTRRQSAARGSPYANIGRSHHAFRNGGTANDSALEIY